MNTTASVVIPRPPRKGLLWLWFKFPLTLYRLHLGWLLGHRRLLLTHQGRKTGRLRQTVLDLVRFDPVTKECLVFSMYGEQADWYQNIQAHPALEVQTGRDRFVPLHRVLPPAEAEAIMTAFWRQYPRGVRLGLRLLGFHYDETEANKQAILSSLRVVSFRPKASS
ncbi:MAG TPA: nitroreductase family deazaflavin-dependent oxidoreductase [Ktedonobacteraceae bacterium]